MANDHIVCLSQLTVINESATQEKIAHMIGELLEKCVGDLDECRVDRPEKVSVLIAAGIATGAVLEWRANGRPDDTPEFRKLQLAAELLNALALLEQSLQSTRIDGASWVPRLVQAAWLVGNLEYRRAMVNLGYLDGYAERKFASMRASQHAKDNVQSRKKQASRWQAPALKAFQERKNHRVTAEAWAISNRKGYPVKADTLAKFLRKARSEK